VHTRLFEPEKYIINSRMRVAG